MRFLLVVTLAVTVFLVDEAHAIPPPVNVPSHGDFAHTLTCANCASFSTQSGLNDAALFFHNVVFSDAIGGSDFAISGQGIAGGVMQIGAINMWIRVKDSNGAVVRLGFQEYGPLDSFRILDGTPTIGTIIVEMGGVIQQIDILIDKGEFYTIAAIITQTYSTTGLATAIHNNGALSTFYAVPSIDVWSGPAGSYTGHSTITEEPSNPNPVSPAPDPQPSDPPPDPCANGGCTPGVPN